VDKKLLNETIKKAIKGDHEAFSDLYREYAKVIVFHVRNYIWDKRDVEDATQEVVLQMFSTISSLRSPYAFSTWLHRVIVSECRGYNARYTKKAGKDDELESAGVLVDEEPSNDPYTVAEQLDQRARIAGYIGELPEIQRMTLIMHYYDDMKYKDIAKALGVTVTTVSTNIMKAKRNLEQILEKDTKSGYKETLSAAALGTPIAESLRYSADNLMPPAEVDRYCDIWSERLGDYWASPQTARSQAVKVAARGALTGKILAVIIGVLVVSGGLFAYFGFGPGAGGSAQDNAGVFVPDAEIILKSADNAANSINPYEASLVIKDGEGISAGWRVIDSLSTEIASGKGETVTTPLEGLPKGEYSIQWIIKNNSAKTIAKRTFYVE
jgi:RNA polymerase sigma-70 factor (ECF subfamily)